MNDGLQCYCADADEFICGSVRQSLVDRVDLVLLSADSRAGCE